MPWGQVSSYNIATTRAMGWVGLVLPPTPGAVAWSLDYAPSRPIPQNLARIGFFVPVALIDGNLVAGDSKSLISRAEDGGKFLQHFDYAYLLNYTGLTQRVSDYRVYIQLVPYCPPGLLRLMALV